VFLDATIVKNLGTVRVCAKIRVVVLIALSIVSVTVIAGERRSVSTVKEEIIELQTDPVQCAKNDMQANVRSLNTLKSLLELTAHNCLVWTK